MHYANSVIALSSIPRLFCRDVAKEIDFCANAFGALEIVRRPGLDGKVAHAMMRFGPVMLMIESEWPGLPSRGPEADGSSPVVIYVYVEDVDKTVERAVAAGARILRPLGNQLWGDRIGWLTDPQGHVWTVATRVEETTEEELDITRERDIFAFVTAETTYRLMRNRG